MYRDQTHRHRQAEQLAHIPHLEAQIERLKRAAKDVRDRAAEANLSLYRWFLLGEIRQSPEDKARELALGEAIDRFDAALLAETDE